MRLSEEEHSVIDLKTDHMDKVLKKGELSLVGRLFSNRVIGSEVVRSTMAKIWKLCKSFSFQEINSICL